MYMYDESSLIWQQYNDEQFMNSALSGERK